MFKWIILKIIQHQRSSIKTNVNIGNQSVFISLLIKIHYVKFSNFKISIQQRYGNQKIDAKQTNHIINQLDLKDTFIFITLILVHTFAYISKKFNQIFLLITQITAIDQNGTQLGSRS